MDYFSIEIEGEIGPLAAVEACFDPANTGALYCNQISRDPVTHDVAEIRQFNINRGLFRTSGIDMQLSLVADLPAALSFGRGASELNVDIIWTHVFELTS